MSTAEDTVNKLAFTKALIKAVKGDYEYVVMTASATPPQKWVEVAGETACT